MRRNRQSLVPTPSFLLLYISRREEIYAKHNKRLEVKQRTASEMADGRAINSFSCLSFDCYGTLIDWERGIYDALEPLRRRIRPGEGRNDSRGAILKAFSSHEGQVQRARPEASYPEVLAAAMGLLAADLGIEASDEDKARFGASVGQWPAFTDSADALRRLQKHYKLAILSNVDRDSFAQTVRQQLEGIQFDAVYTAQEIGSYKPDVRNFEYLIEHIQQDLGLGQQDMLHVAQSLHHDHVPAKKMGLATVWIERGEDGEQAMGGNVDRYQDLVSYRWRFKKLADMADAVERAAESLSSKA